MSTGRNDPCPCNSGKKYKKCCLTTKQNHTIESLSYRRYREIESQLIGRLFRHAAEVFGPTSIEEAWDEFHCWEHSEGYDPGSPINQVFGPFFLFGWEIDPTETDCDLALEGKTIAESFMDANRSRLTPEELEILMAANRPLFTFYRITDVTPGQKFSLKDIFTEALLEVTECSGSQGAKSGNVIYGSLFEINGRQQVLAMSPYTLPPLTLQPLLDVRKNLRKELGTKKLTDLHVMNFEIELRDIYFRLLEQLLNPKMPKLCNTDGEPLVPQTLHFEITDSEEAFLALKSLTTGIITEGELRSDATLKGGRIHKVEIPWFKKNKSAPHPGSNTLLGTIKITGTKLTAEVNSNKRATTIKKKIASALGSQVRFKTKVTESIEGNLRDTSRQRAKSSAIPLDQLPPEALEAAKKMAEAHWTQWFDKEIPALNNKTPKQAARSKEGRELLEALLHSYEDRSRRADNELTNLLQPDINELREKLGLT